MGASVPGGLHQAGEPHHWLRGTWKEGSVLCLENGCDLIARGGGGGGIGSHGYTHYTTHLLYNLQKINGPRLLLLREEEDLHTLGIVHGFPAAGLLEAIDELRHQEYYRPRNFQEYRAGHQKQTLLLAICYKLWPRTTLLYTYMFSYDDVFVPVLKTYFPALGQGRVQEGGQHLESQTQPGSTESEAEAKQLGEEGTVVIAEEGTEVCVLTLADV